MKRLTIKKQKGKLNSISQRHKSLCSILTGTAGPGAGVDWVTVVMALLWVVLTGPVVAVEEASSVLLVASVPSSVCWAADRNIQRGHMDKHLLHLA